MAQPSSLFVRTAPAYHAGCGMDIRLSPFCISAKPGYCDLVTEQGSRWGYNEDANQKKGECTMAVLNISKHNFEQVKNSEKTVLLDFYAGWCGPCRMVSPLVEQIAQENPQYLVGKVDVDGEPELAQAFGVVSIPTLVVMRNGRIVNQAAGARPKPQILAMLQG